MSKIKCSECANIESKLADKRWLVSSWGHFPSGIYCSHRCYNTAGKRELKEASDNSHIVLTEFLTRKHREDIRRQRDPNG